MKLLLNNQGVACSSDRTLYTVVSDDYALMYNFELTQLPSDIYWSHFYITTGLKPALYTLSIIAENFSHPNELRNLAPHLFI